MSQIVDGYKSVVTQGTYMGEGGTGYGWGTLSEYGDFSEATRGHIQGYTRPCRIEILVEGAVLEESGGREPLLYVPAGTTLLRAGSNYDIRHEWGLTAAEAIAYGLARVIEDEP